MKKYIIYPLILVGLLVSFSCEDYLDRDPETIIGKEDVFKDFDHAQGFVEEMYALVVDHVQAGHGVSDYLYGDDGRINTAWMPTNKIDKGDLWFWVKDNKFTIFNNEGRKNDPKDPIAHNRPGIWHGSMMGIRKANQVIENISLMVNATQEEIDVVLGQAYFFRAFFHLEIMKYWGRFPYIDKVIAEDWKLQRPATYKECALKANDDFRRAAELLPINWDDHSFGEKTFGDNMGRVTKGAAYAYQGKNLLLAASPLMHGSKNTYEYDTELADMSVDALAEVLKLVEQGTYSLVPFDKYEEVFWKVDAAKIWPGSTEFIFNGSSFRFNDADNIVEVSMDKKIAGGGGKTLSPTHNFIHYNFGMANGLSIEDDLSGAYGPSMYDPTKPFENRDPRFYKWITVDGDVTATKASAGKHRNAQLYIGGEHRGGSSGSETGYFFKKFYPTLHSKWNKIATKHTPWRIRMRLTDVYLMYAEALHAAKKSATIAPDSYHLTAEDVINIIRDRAGIPHVNASIVADSDKFMDELRRDRSVELSFEAHRWVDIRRWVVAHLDRYKNKTAFDFPKDHSYFNERIIISRVCEYPKHYWLPFEKSQTQFYEGFQQNPGW